MKFVIENDDRCRDLCELLNETTKLITFHMEWIIDLIVSMETNARDGNDKEFDRELQLLEKSVRLRSEYIRHFNELIMEREPQIREIIDSQTNVQ